MAALFFIFGAIVITDSVRLGFGWQEVHGPRPGYFPFYIGLLICASAAINFVRMGHWLMGKPLAKTRLSAFERVMRQCAPC